MTLPASCSAALPALLHRLVPWLGACLCHGYVCCIKTLLAVVVNTADAAMAKAQLRSATSTTDGRLTTGSWLGRSLPCAYVLRLCSKCSQDLACAMALACIQPSACTLCREMFDACTSLHHQRPRSNFEWPASQVAPDCSEDIVRVSLATRGIPGKIVNFQELLLYATFKNPFGRSCADKTLKQSFPYISDSFSSSKAGSGTR